MINNNYTIQARLLDFDGVVVDTEPQYSIFWGEQGRKYRPDIPHLEQRIKGQTLQHILETYFGESKKIQEQIVADLYTFEAHMKFEYVPGLREFITDAKALGLKSAIVTSSDLSDSEREVVAEVNKQYLNSGAIPWTNCKPPFGLK